MVDAASLVVEVLNLVLTVIGITLNLQSYRLASRATNLALYAERRRAAEEEWREFLQRTAIDPEKARVPVRRMFANMYDMTCGEVFRALRGPTRRLLMDRPSEEVRWTQAEMIVDVAFGRVWCYLASRPEVTGLEGEGFLFGEARALADHLLDFEYSEPTLEAAWQAWLRMYHVVPVVPIRSFGHQGEQEGDPYASQVNRPAVAPPRS